MRVFYEAHDFWGDPSVRDAPLTAGQRRNVRLERRWAPRVDGIVCVSAPQGRLYERTYPSVRVIVAHTGCKPVWTPPRAALTRRLGYVGSFVPGKYPLDVVVAGLAACPDRRVRLRCVGAKDGAEADGIRDLVRRLGVADRVEVHPWTAGEALRDLIRGMDVGVAPLGDQFLNRIASPLKVLEYLAAAMPCIASRLEGIEDLVTHGIHGQLVENTPAAWAEAMGSVYADEAAYRRMASACAERAGRLSWRARAETMLKALTSNGGAA
jgi:glycosyltransferase involved in cell wall biosynthesis